MATSRAKSLAAWPTTHQFLGDIETLALSAHNKEQHRFSYVEGQIHCIMCIFPPMKGDVDHKEGDGFPRAIVEAIESSRINGHRCKAAVGEGRLCFFCCTKCHSHTRSVPTGFAKKCSGVRSKAGAWALQCTRQGRDLLDGSACEIHYEAWAKVNQ